MASPPHLARVVLTGSEMVKALAEKLVVPVFSGDGYCLVHCGLTWPLFQLCLGLRGTSSQFNEFILPLNTAGDGGDSMPTNHLVLEPISLTLV